MSGRRRPGVPPTITSLDRLCRFASRPRASRTGPGSSRSSRACPRGSSSTASGIDRDMARRQLGHGRGGRMKIETRRRRGPLGHPPRPHARQPDRAAGRQPRLRQLGGADEPVAGRRRGRGGPPAAARATPTSPALLKYGHSRRAQRARARQRARDRGARRRRRDREGVPARARRERSTATCCGSARSARPSATDLRPEDFAGVDDSPGALPRRRAPARRWSPRSTACARRTRASAGSSRCAPSACVPGLGSHVSWERAPRRPPRAGALVSIQAVKGVVGRRGLGGRGRARLGVPRRDLLVRRSAAGTARRTAPAGSRAGCRTASRSSCAAR